MIECYFEDGSQAKVGLRHTCVDNIVLNPDRTQILLVKRADDDFSEPGKWCLPGGYVDRDETVDVAAAREIREETGYLAESPKLVLVNSNPDRPHDHGRQNVVLVFEFQASQKIGEHDHEVSELKWFDLDNLPNPEDIAFDHAKVIEFYLREYDGSKPSVMIW